jgi:hypothetical protein
VVIQYDSLKHLNTADDDEGLATTITVGLTASGPGGSDTATATVDVQDDGPSLADPANTVLRFVNSATALPAGIASEGAGVEVDGDDTVAIDFNPGEDDEGADLVFTDFTDPDNAGDLASSNLDALEALVGDITAVLSPDGKTITYYTDGGTVALFRVSLDTTNPESYDAEVLQDAPVIVTQTPFFDFGSGSPTETITVTTNIGTSVVFDGLLFTAADAREIGTPTNLPASDADDLNPNNLGFGVKAGQASNINNNEGWQMTFVDSNNAAKSVEGISFVIDQTGNTDDVVLAFSLTKGGPGGGNDPTLVQVLGATGQTTVSGTQGGNFFVHTTMPSGNNSLIVTILDDQLAAAYTKAANEIVIVINGEFDLAQFRAAFPQDLNPIDYDATPFENDSIRVHDFAVMHEVQVPDVRLTLTTQGTDGDDDPTTAQTFTVDIDGNHDGLIML